MSKSAIIIEVAGLMSTVQDMGRFGYQRFGMSVGGAMDQLSMQLANILVGNHPGAACIEATLTGPTIRFIAAANVAVCGADMQPQINAVPAGHNRLISVKAGDLLSFGGLRSGCRTYIAFSGGVAVKPVMGSRSTYLAAGLGGHAGRALKQGDELELGKVLNWPAQKKIPKPLLVDYSLDKPIRILPGPEIKRFGFESIRKLLTTSYMVSTQSNRMGYRLQGKPLITADENADIISSGIPMGTLQVPANGQPILLMADRQTTGGYPRIAVVAGVDLTHAAQLKPGDQLNFSEIKLEKAQVLIKERQKLLAAFASF